MVRRPHERVAIDDGIFVYGKRCLFSEKKVFVNRENVKRALKTLKDNGYIVRVGSDKTGHWEIKD